MQISALAFQLLRNFASGRYSPPPDVLSEEGMGGGVKGGDRRRERRKRREEYGILIESPGSDWRQFATNGQQDGSNFVKFAGAVVMTSIFVHLTFLNTTVIFILNNKGFYLCRNGFEVTDVFSQRFWALGHVVVIYLSTSLLKVIRVVFWCLWTSIATI